MVLLFNCDHEKGYLVDELTIHLPLFTLSPTSFKYPASPPKSITPTQLKMGKSTLKTDLNRIVSACKDSSGTYAAAADSTRNVELKNTLSLIAVQRKSYCELLRQEAWKEGIRLSLTDSPTRTILNYVGTIFHLSVGKDDMKIIEACKSKEESLVDKYDEVLTHQDLSINLHQLMLEHQRLVRQTMSEQLGTLAHA